MTWRKAIEKVLSEAPGAVHYSELTDKIISDSLRSNLGATPAATVSAFLTTQPRSRAKEINAHSKKLVVAYTYGAPRLLLQQSPRQRQSLRLQRRRKSNTRLYLPLECSGGETP